MEKGRPVLYQKREREDMGNSFFAHLTGTDMIRQIFGGLLVLLSIQTMEVQAQVLPLPASPARAYYRFAEPGDLTMQVKVWGDVMAPGLYEISQGTSLSTLLSLAGGPNLGRTTRQDVTLHIRLLRDQGGRDAEVYQVVMENGIVSLEDDPVLDPNDMLVVERVMKERFGWRDLLPFISSGASLGVLVLNIVRFSR